MEVGWIMANSSQRVNRWWLNYWWLFFTWRKRRSKKRLTRMEVGWIMVSSSQRINRRGLNDWWLFISGGREGQERDWPGWKRAGSWSAAASKSTGEGLITGDFSYLEKEKVKKEIDQDGSGLDHDQEQPESKQVKAELLVTFYTWRKRRSRKRLTRMEVGWIMVRSSQGANSWWVSVLKISLPEYYKI